MIIHWMTLNLDWDFSVKFAWISTKITRSWSTHSQGIPTLWMGWSWSWGSRGFEADIAVKSWLFEFRPCSRLGHLPYLLWIKVQTLVQTSGRNIIAIDLNLIIKTSKWPYPTQKIWIRSISARYLEDQFQEELLDGDARPAVPLLLTDNKAS